MRAVAIEEFGGREKIRLLDLPEPVLAPDFVRIGIRAAGANPVDWKTREGRQASRFPHVFPVVLGWDAAGVVLEVGPAVTRWRAGDEVMAYCRKHFVGEGTYAEQVTVPEEFCAAKPASLSWAEAGALPLAALTAYQCLVERLRLKEGETVLVQSGAGGVGHFAVQIAAALGAKPIATASERNRDFLLGLGAVDVVDYASGELPQVDVALDVRGGEDLARTKAVAGRVVSIVEPGDGHLYHFVRPSGDELAELGRMVEAGTLRVEIERTLPLEEAAAAHELLEARHVRGKLALLV